MRQTPEAEKCYEVMEFRAQWASTDCTHMGVSPKQPMGPQTMGIFRELPSLCGMGLKAAKLAGGAVPTPSPHKCGGAHVSLHARVKQSSGVGLSPAGDISPMTIWMTKILA